MRGGRLLAGVAALWLASCNQSEMDRAKDSVRKALKDPDSARFGAMYKGPAGAVCGFVNAKNSFGGYSGDKAFVVGDPVGYVRFSPGSGDISDGLAALDDLTGASDFWEVWDCNCKTAEEQTKDAVSDGRPAAKCASLSPAVR